MSQPQTVNINFAEGLNTKTDPWQVPVGQFLVLQNSIFDKGGLLQKRNGYDTLPSLPNTSYSYLTTLNGNLTAIGPTVAAYSEGSQNWVTKGSITPVEVSTLPLIRNSLNQVQCDIVVAPNGLACTAYTESNNVTTSYKYVISDSTTGQNVVQPTAIPVSSGTVSGSLRVFLLDNYFIVAFTNVISSANHLQYIAININNPSNVTTNADLASSYVPSSAGSWDGIVSNNKLYYAYDTTSGGQAVKVNYLDSTLNTGTAVTFSSYTATLMSLCVDTTQSGPPIYVSFYNSATSTGYTLGLALNLATVFSPQEIITTVTIANITSAALNGTCTIYYEVSNMYGYDSSIPSNYINAVTCSSAGTVGSVVNIIRSVGLASKAFIVKGQTYFLTAFQSPYQNTYFLLSGASLTSSPVIIAKLAYENGAGYLTKGLPGVLSSDNVAQIPYLYKDFIEAQAPGGIQSINLQVPPVYSQTGINLASIELNSTNIDTIEIASVLQTSGGFGLMYDGYLPVEQNFFVWPDSVEVSTSTSSVTPTGTTTSGSKVITALSSVAGIGIGMTVSGTGVAIGSLVTGITATTVTLSLAATGSYTAETITFVGNVAAQPDGSTNTDAYYVQAIYSWVDNQGNQHRSAPSIPVAITTSGGGTDYIFTYSVPTLRLTYKIANPVKIQVYRWSVANQVYYETTSIIQPTLNSTTTDYVTIVDGQSDAQILGNNIIYTTGGVVEDINPPASNILSLFDTRAWLVDAEDPTLLWFSKQNIENVPVEWSDLFTFYVSPTTAAQGSTGNITALCPLDDKLIIFKNNAIYYINGTGPDNTGANNGYSNPTFITSTVGCANQQSIVFMPQGLMFQSDKGIWLLGRDLSTQYIGAAVEQYTQFDVGTDTQPTVLSAINVPETNQVRFTLDTGITLMFDYFYGQWGTFVGIPGTSSTIYQNLHTFINAEGLVYQETPNQYLDGSNPVLLSFTTSWLNLASLQGYERFRECYLLGQYLSPHSLWVKVAYDYNPSPATAVLITPQNFSSSAPSPFGVPTPVGAPGNLEQWRIHSKQQLCQSFQITVQEVFNPAYGTLPGAGLTLSGINCNIILKKATRPIRAANAAGLS
jgi:hypothetical protein